MIFVFGAKNGTEMAPMAPKKMKKGSEMFWTGIGPPLADAFTF